MKRSQMIRAAIRDGHAPSEATHIAREMHRQMRDEEGGTGAGGPHDGFGYTDQPTVEQQLDENANGPLPSDEEEEEEDEPDAMASGGLTAAQRNRMKPSTFAVPSKRAFPLNNISHARNALARAAGKSVEPQVRAAVHRKFPSLGGPK